MENGQGTAALLTSQAGLDHTRRALLATMPPAAPLLLAALLAASSPWAWAKAKTAPPVTWSVTTSSIAYELDEYYLGFNIDSGM